MQYGAVIFDLFGTLVEHFPMQTHEQIITQMAAILQVSRADFAPLWSEETWLMRAMGVFADTEANLGFICATLHIQVPASRLAGAAQLRLDYLRQRLIPRPAALSTLARLKQRGYPLGLISDCSSEVPRLWPMTPFAPLIDVPIFSCAVGLKKPQPEIYLAAVQHLGVVPEQCLYIGDGGSQELTGAERVGMHPILLRSPQEEAFDPHGMDADGWQGPTIGSLQDVLTILGPP